MLGTVRTVDSVGEASQARIIVEQVELRDVDPVLWDADAIRCGASMRSAYAHLRHMGLKHLLRGASRTCRIVRVAGGCKQPIGHYTLARHSGVCSFYDGINLFPEYRDLWTKAMHAALSHTGGGIFEYGWRWSPEPSRSKELSTIRGVEFLSTRDILIQGVDFSNWPDWDSYYRDISENIRRNAKKASKLHPDIKVVILRGRKSLRHMVDLVRMRRTMYQRKGVPFNPIRVMAGYLLNLVACPEQMMIATATAEDRILAIQNIVEFGDTHYYLDGAAADHSDGGAWNLQLSMLERAYRRSPSSRFLLGYTDLPVADQAAEGLLRSRRSLRASDWPTSLIRFRWTPQDRPAEADPA